MKIFLIDDEKPAIEYFKFLIANIKTDIAIQLVGYSNSLDEFVEYSNNGNKIDVLFLDINLKGENGFDLFKKIIKINFSIIFTTAYSEYAIKAFKFRAIDYLLKPILLEDLLLALKKVSLCKPDETEMVNYYKDINNYISKALTTNKITINTHIDNKQVNYNEIIYIKAEGAYSRIYTTKERDFLVSKNLNTLIREFPKEIFVRIHRSYIINIKYIKNQDNIGSTVELINGAFIPVSRRKLDVIISFLKLFK
jgi:two-component system LytT family response regulator